MKFATIVLQGPIFSGTIDTAKEYLKLDFVDKVIISCWKEDKKHEIANDDIEYIFSDLPKHSGGGNINYQIVSSQNGIKKCTSEVVIKMRSDQRVTLESMNMMNRFFNKFNSSSVSYQDNSGPIGSIFVIGMHGLLPYHPQDHIFWGYREDVTTLFNIPLSPWSSFSERRADFKNKDLRCPMHIGTYYYLRFNDKIQLYIDNPKTYLLDSSPKINEAIETCNLIKDDVFKVFPRIDLHWEKYNTSYLYDGYGAQGEYYYDKEWE